MRQVSLQLANAKAGRDEDGQDLTRQIHILTTRTHLTAGEVIRRMGFQVAPGDVLPPRPEAPQPPLHDAYATSDDEHPDGPQPTQEDPC